MSFRSLSIRPVPGAASRCIRLIEPRPNSCFHSFRRLLSDAARSRHDRPFRMAVVGSGPAGFYTSYRVMSLINDAKVDMYEALPVPFGLVRFGVAPDHPEVKVCQSVAYSLILFLLCMYGRTSCFTFPSLTCKRRTARTNSQKSPPPPTSPSSATSQSATRPRTQTANP